MDDETRARLTVFEHLTTLSAQHDEGVLPRTELERGVLFEGDIIRLIGPQGIFKPRRFTLPLSITTAPPVPGKEPPYPDQASDDRLFYSYRGRDPNHRDNVGLRQAMEQGVPLVYFFGVTPGRYLATCPVHVVADDPARLQFTVSLDASATGQRVLDAAAEDPGRRYAVHSVRYRLHQRAFRVRVLEAYRRCCAMCRLRHTELLDAAHIVPDAEEDSSASVTNGLALCRLHHAAFDAHILGVRDDLVIHLRRDILEEVDGPMLRHGLQAMQGQRLEIPRSRASQPEPALLRKRFERFLAAG